jgi:hypothetical protein
MPGGAALTGPTFLDCLLLIEQIMVDQVFQQFLMPL